MKSLSRDSIIHHVSRVLPDRVIGLGLGYHPDSSEAVLRRRWTYTRYLSPDQPRYRTTKGGLVLSIGIPHVSRCSFSS